MFDKLSNGAIWAAVGVALTVIGSVVVAMIKGGGDKAIATMADQRMLEKNMIDRLSQQASRMDQLESRCDQLARAELECLEREQELKNVVEGLRKRVRCLEEKAKRAGNG